MRRLFASLITLSLSLMVAPVQGQTETAEVRAAVDALFDAMRVADGVAAASLFRDDARLQSVSIQDGRTVGTTDEASAFIQAVGTPRTQRWDERIWNVEVRVDGDLAGAWMNYAFYVDDQFSHCGVNAFQLVRSDGRWRILQITDTRRRTGCEPPA